MEVNDLDLASAGPVLLIDQPGSHPHELITAGKTGTIYVINRDNMGHYNSSSDNQIIQSLPGILPNGTDESGNYSAPVYFNGTIYYCAVTDSVKAFQLTNGLLSTAPTSMSPEVFGFPGGAMSASGIGTTNGILWVVQRNGETSPGVLYAYNASNLGDELYSSNQSGGRDLLDYAAKFNPPVVANGKVYVATMSTLTVYGILP
jgi:outer membrane protein assembly factor BamB